MGWEVSRGVFAELLGCYEKHIRQIMECVP